MRGKTEGMLSSVALKFENGLMLKSDSCLWIGKEKTNNLIALFIEVVDSLEKHGIKIEENEALEELRKIT